MNEQEFDKIFERIGKSGTVIETSAVLGILAGIVKDSEKDNPDIVKLAEAVKEYPLEETVCKIILFTCNSVIMNIWNVFGKEIEEAYNKKMAAAEVKPEDKPAGDA